MTRLIIVEARRLLPLAVLFLMLLAVSIYDGVSSPAVPVTGTVDTIPYRSLSQGTVAGGKELIAVTDLDMWLAVHKVLGISLSDYDFNPDAEVALVLINCQARGTQQKEDGTVEVHVLERRHSFQIILLDRSQLIAGGHDVSYIMIMSE